MSEPAPDLPKRVRDFLANFPKARLKKATRPGTCPLLGCSRDLGQRQSLCACHEKRLARFLDPLTAFYDQIKNRARRKKIEFTITKDEFRDLVAETGYMEGRGRSPSSLHIDREDATKGYVPGNLRILTARQNCSKAHEDKLRRRAHVEAATGIKLPPLEEPELEELPDNDEPDVSDVQPFTPTDDVPF